MKILFLTHYFPPESNAPASRVYEMAKRWVADGHQVTVMTGVPNCPDGIVHEGYRNGIRRQVEMVDGIRVVRVWTYIAANEGTLRRTLNFVSFMISAVWAGLFLERHDVLIATSPQFFCGWAGVFLSKLRRMPFVLEIRDIWPESIVAVGAMSNRRVIDLLEKLEKWMYAAATHIVAVGEGYKRRIVAKGVDASRISIITNGVDTNLFRPRGVDEDIRSRHNLDHHFVCAYVGTLGMACGMDVAVKAGRILKERGHTRIRLMLIGDGAMRQKLEDDIRKYNLDNIILTGKLPRASIPGYLASVDACLVHLKKTDLFKSVLPSKMFEAAAMERPIILGVEGDAADLVRDASAGICFEPEDAEELVAAMLKLAQDNDLRQSYGRAAREYVVRHFDRNALAGSYLKLLSVLLTRRSTEYARESAETGAVAHVSSTPQKGRVNPVIG